MSKCVLVVSPKGQRLLFQPAKGVLVSVADTGEEDTYLLIELAGEEAEAARPEAAPPPRDVRGGVAGGWVFDPPIDMYLIGRPPKGVEQWRIDNAPSKGRQITVAEIGKLLSDIDEDGFEVIRLDSSRAR